jgi:hypothetical protein
MPSLLMHVQLWIAAQQACVVLALAVASPRSTPNYASARSKIFPQNPNLQRAVRELRPNQVLNPLVNRTKRRCASPRKYHETATRAQVSTEFTKSPDSIV